MVIPPVGRVAPPPPPVRRSKITPDSINLSGEDFYNVSYTNAERDKTQIMFSKMYMLGVFDATDGRLCCNYWTFHSHTLRAWIYSYFHDLSKDKLKKKNSFTTCGCIASQLSFMQEEQMKPLYETLKKNHHSSNKSSSDYLRPESLYQEIGYDHNVLLRENNAYQDTCAVPKETTTGCSNLIKPSSFVPGRA